MSKAVKLLTFIFAAAFACVASAGVSFAYQGVLRDANGNKINTKNQSIQFRLYNSPTDSNMLWGRTIAVLLDDDGLFNVELSDNNGSPINTNGKALADVLKETANTTLYVGLSVVDGSGSTAGEIRPRQRILSVPYAAIAGDVKTANGNLEVAEKLSAKSVEVPENGSLVVKGTTSMKKALTVNNKATVTGNLDVGGSVSVAGTITGTVVRNGVDIAPPVGMIVMWYGDVNSIPDGWVLCNGQKANGHQTPDLTGRFVVGAGNPYDGSRSGTFYAKGATGGENSVKLTLNQMPSHQHITNFSTQGYESGRKTLDEVLATSVCKANGEAKSNPYHSSKPPLENMAMWPTDYRGGNAAHENRPPYYALCYIMRIK